MKLTTRAAAVAAVLLLPACSSSNTSTNTAGSSLAPIKLLVISQIQAPSFGFPEAGDGAQAAAAAINAAGGVDGHQVSVDVCNDQGDPNVAATCARRAVQDGYMAVINPVELYAASVLPLLEAGKIAAVGGTPLTPPDFSSTSSFPLAGGNPLDYGGTGLVAGKNNCPSVAIIRDTVASVDESSRGLAAGAKAGGATVVATIKAPSASPDFASPVSQVVASGAVCVLVAEPPAAIAKVVGALRQSSKPTMPLYTIGVAFPAAIVKALGPAANNVVVADSFQIPDAAVTPTFWKDMTTYRPDAARSGQALLAWGGVQAIAQVAKAAGAYDHASLLAALGKATSVTIEGFPQAFNFSSPNANAGFARIFATSVYAWTIQDGAYHPLFNGDAQDVSQVLSAGQ